MPQTPGTSLVAGSHCVSSLLLLSDQDATCVHPDDLPAARQSYPHGLQLLCFRYWGQELGYDVLDDGALRLRVRGAVIEPIPTPQFNRGDRVFAYPKQAVGLIRQVIWHLKRECVFYMLEFKGRRSGRWYFESDQAAPGKA